MPHHHHDHGSEGGHAHVHHHGHKDAHVLTPSSSLLRASAAARLALAAGFVAVVWGGVFWAVS